MLPALANIHAVNEKGEQSVDIDRVDQQHISATSLNFKLVVAQK